MHHSNLRPSTIRILQSDYVAFLGVITPVVLLAMYIAISYLGFLPGFRGHDPIQGESGAPFFFYGTIIAVAIGIPVTMWRIRSISTIFEGGAEAHGQVSSIWFHRDRGRVNYTYDYQGQSYSCGSAIMKNRQSRGLEPGMEVTIVVDRNNPGRALIRDLYVRTRANTR